MHETQTESHTPVQYNSRRERREAEGYVRGQLNEREILAVERAHNYLDTQRATTLGHLANKALSPNVPLYGFVDKEGNAVMDTLGAHGLPVEITHDLDTQVAILNTYEQAVDARNWAAISELDSQWQTNAAAAGEYRSAAGRQHWINQHVQEVKHNDEFSRRRAQHSQQTFEKAA